jgi:PAS domain S-box-containing protein
MTEVSSLVNALPGLVWTALSDGTVDFLNQRWCEYTGLSLNQVSGSVWQTVVHPDDLPDLLERWRFTLASGEPGEIEARLRRFDGDYRWFLIAANPMRDDAEHVVKWVGLNTDIEDRKQTEQALQQRDLSFQLIVDSIPVPVAVTTPIGEVERLNQLTLEYFGKLLEGLKDWATAPGIVHSEDHKRTVAGTEVDVEARTRRFDGVYRFLFRASPLRDESGNIIKWYGTNVDIEDQKRAEEELRRSEAFLAEGQRLNLTGSFSWRLDTDEIIFPEQLYRIYEFDHNAPVTLQQIGSRVHPEDMPLLSEKIAQARVGNSTDLNYEIRLLMQDDSIKYPRTLTHVIPGRDGRLEIIGVVQDITERRLSEEALDKVRSELARMTRVASLEALSASIAHEVNQPLSGIVTNASTCLRMLAADPPNIQGALETAGRMIRDGNRASEVITQLRSLFTNNGAVTEQVNLNEATREVMALSLSELQRNRVIVRSELADDLPHITGDRIQLQQVILNLLLNASDAMSSVDDRPRRLVVKTERVGDDSVRMTVEDTGVGIEPQNIDKIFDAFYTTKRSGIGMGLSVSRSIIESHHGRLWAAPNDGPGATFSFSIPYAPGATGDCYPGTIQTSALTDNLEMRNP